MTVGSNAHQLPGLQVGDADDIAARLIGRIADPAVLSAAIDASRRTSTLPTGVQWRDPTMAAGYVGTALMFAVADACRPGDGWDRVGHRHLEAAGTAVAGAPVSTSLFSGLAGFGFAACQLSAGRGRYGSLLRSIDAALLPRVEAAAARLGSSPGCGVGAFDLISGLTGTGVYLLGRTEDSAAAATLRAVLTGLSRLLADRSAPRRWHTPPGMIAGPMAESFPNGNHNCGLAHGVPGPLALLSIAAKEGVVVDGMEDAIHEAAQWIVLQGIETDLGPDWPNAVDLRPVAGGAPPLPNRSAWCYGAPGVARALWLAGTATGQEEYRDVAMRATRSALARNPRQRALTSPTFCHGIAGLTQICLRFAADTGAPEIAAGTATLLSQLIDAYEPDATLGYRSVEPGAVRVDQPGLLDGAAGVATTLLTASRIRPDAGPSWDRLFLLA